MTACVKRQFGRLSRLKVWHKVRVGVPFAFLLGLIALAIFSPASAQPAQAPQAFGRDVEFTVAMREGRTPLGEIALRIGGDGSFSVPLPSLVNVIAGKINPEARAALSSLPNDEGYISLIALRQAGYELTFNDAELELVLSLPVSARVRTNYSVSGGRDGEEGDFDAVAPYALAVNIRANLDYLASDASNDTLASGTINVLGRIQKMAFQSNYRLSSRSNFPSRESSRLIYDDVGRALRWQAGDVRPFSSSPLGGEDLLGFGVSRELQALQPDRLVRMRGAQSFSIEEPSEVTVSVNGRVITRQNFTPGNYDISDFPLLVGRNQVDVSIRSQSGQTESLSFNQFLDTRLLDANSDDFGMAFGLASRLSNNSQRRYDAGDFVLNAYYLKGVSDRLTLGVATNLSERRRNFLTTGVYAGATGVVSGRLGLNEAQSGQKNVNFGVSLVQVRGAQDRDDSSASLRVSFDTRLDLRNSEKHNYNASIGYSWPISRHQTGTADIRYANSGLSVGFQTSYAVTRDIRLDFGIDWRDNDVNGRAGIGVSIGLSRSFGGGGQARANYGSRLEDTRLSYTKTPATKMGAWSTSVDLVQGQQTTNLTTAQSAFFNRFETAVAQNMSWQKKAQSQRISLSMGSALALVGGRFAWGRPVTDSFAILSGHKSLEGRTISFESRGASVGPTARTGRFGPALISGLGTYAPRTITIAVDDPPDGYDIGNGTFRVLPPLFGGYHFVIGSDMAMTVTGILMLPDGRPAALISGVATSLDNQALPPIVVFTNLTGQFSLTGIGAGRWSLKMRGVADPFVFALSSNGGNFVDLGTLQTVGAP